MAPRRPIFGPVPASAFRASLLAYLLLRLYLGTLPGYAWDTGIAKTWALGSALGGLSGVYDNTGYDYPPFLIYWLHPLAKLYLALHPELAGAEVERPDWDELILRTPDGRRFRSKWEVRADLPDAAGAGPLPGGRGFTLLVKAPGLLFDALAAALLYALVARGGSWGRARRGPGWGRWAALLYLWNPAVLWNSGYWGQTDSINGALALASLALLGSGRLLGAGVALAAAGLMKPLAAPLVPLLAWFAAAARGARGLALAAAGGSATALLLFLPFLVTGRSDSVLRRVLADVDVFPFTSVNAHNLWWLLGPWQSASEPRFGGLSATAIAMSLFGASYALLLWRSRGWAGGAGFDEAGLRARILLLGGAVTASFFFLSTHMHENHLFGAIPLLLAVAGRSRRLLALALATSGCCWLNMALHDLDLPHALPLIGGPSPVANPIQAGGHTHYTWGQLVGSTLNALAVGLTAAGVYVTACRADRDVAPDPEPAG